jgi:hypothetical protein
MISKYFRHTSMVTYCSATGSGAFLGAGAGAKMLAQLFFTPSGIMLEVGLAGTAMVVGAAAFVGALS